MNTPMFGEQDKNEVTAQFNEFGTLEITIGQHFNKTQISQWQAGASRIPGVKLTQLAGYVQDQTVLAVFMRPEYSTRTHEVRAAVYTYTASFLADMQDIPQQTSLF